LKSVYAHHLVQRNLKNSIYVFSATYLILHFVEITKVFVY